MQVLGNLRSVLKGVDRLSEESEWPRTESELKDFLYRLEQANSSAQEPLDASRVEELRNRVEDAVAQRDRDAAVQLIDVLRQAYSEVVSNEVGYWLGLLESFRTQSDVMQWSDRRRAEELLRQGVRLANENPSVAALRPIVFELFDLLPNEERIRAEAQGIVSR
jgi:molecular chaperone DnaK